MSDHTARGEDPVKRWSRALTAAALFAVDPWGMGGVLLRAPWGRARDRWMAELESLWPDALRLHRMPHNIGDASLFGGLDLAMTLQAGRPVYEPGFLAQANGDVVVLQMAERIEETLAARLTGVLNRGTTIPIRGGANAAIATCFGIVAWDEGIDADEKLLPTLADRLAIHIDLNGFSVHDVAAGSRIERNLVEAARQRLCHVTSDEATVTALCHGALAMGVTSLHAPYLALRVACAAAALYGRDAVSEDDLAIAGSLVLGPRATTLPQPSEASPTQEENEASTQAPDNRDVSSDAATNHEGGAGPLQEVVLAASAAALPEHLLGEHQSDARPTSPHAMVGKRGAQKYAYLHGRPAGLADWRPGEGRIDVIATLRNAAPWQRLRHRPQGARALEVRRSDLRLKRFRQHAESATVFVVDASGSAAMHRLAEAKGAVELLLADCYVRRDSVSLLAFRRDSAEVLLPPTRSLARAKRCLAALPGGGGTPMAAAIDEAQVMARSLRHKGQTPLVVFLTDGRANVARDGSGGRAQAHKDALAAARVYRSFSVATIWIDTSPRILTGARDLADALGANYVALPKADSRKLSQAVRDRQTTGGAGYAF